MKNNNTYFIWNKIQNYLGIIIVKGWINTKRDHGNIIFMDLRDIHGNILQIMDNKQLLKHIKNESVVEIHGELIIREKDRINNNIDFGSVEVVLNNVIVLGANIHNELPININNGHQNDLCQKYNYLTLRGNYSKNIITQRAKIIQFLRNFMIDEEFTEINTPIMTASSPEGARDFIIPSRLYNGYCYALPQSPQKYKQLLMGAGFKYFQIAPCFRDEDSRHDRSPTDFYQLDLETPFVNVSDMIIFIKKIILSLFNKFSTKKVNNDIPIMSYKDVMTMYGSDKPDLRNPIYIKDFTEQFKDTDFTIFKTKIDKGALVRGIIIPSLNSNINKKNTFNDIAAFWLKKKQPLAYAYYDHDKQEIVSPIKKFINFPIDQYGGIFFVCDFFNESNKYINNIINYLGDILKCLKDEHSFVIVNNFPMWNYCNKNNTYDFCHNPFSMISDPETFLKSKVVDPNMTCEQYDLVCNGYEICSGGIRNHRVDIIHKICELLKYDDQKKNDVFEPLLTGFSYGFPPHGGAAFGVERLLMILLDGKSIKDVIPFPTLQSGKDLLMDSPKPINNEQQQELSLMIQKTILKKTTQTMENTSLKMSTINISNVNNENDNNINDGSNLECI